MLASTGGGITGILLRYWYNSSLKLKMHYNWDTPCSTRYLFTLQLPHAQKISHWRHHQFYSGSPSVSDRLVLPTNSRVLKMMKSITVCILIASCAVVQPEESILIGVSGGILSMLTPYLMDKIKINVPVGAFSVHGVSGFWVSQMKPNCQTTICIEQ